MLKKIALVMLLALPMGVFAQNLKFGHINAQEIITVMPEFTKAQNDIQTLEKQLTAELQRTQEECDLYLRPGKNFDSLCKRITEHQLD